MCCYRSRLAFNCCFKDTDISQGSVATHLRCDRIFIDSTINKCSRDSDDETSLKIGQYLTKLRRDRFSNISKGSNEGILGMADRIPQGSSGAKPL